MFLLKGNKGTSTEPPALKLTIPTGSADRGLCSGHAQNAREAQTCNRWQQCPHFLDQPTSANLTEHLATDRAHWHPPVWIHSRLQEGVSTPASPEQKGTRCSCICLGLARLITSHSEPSTQYDIISQASPKQMQLHLSGGSVIN